MATPDMEVIKEIPGYKVILKAVLKSQIQQLVEQLATYTEEESIILTASVADGTLSHLGSDSGKSFLDDHEDVKSQFLGFCLKWHHKKKLDEEREEVIRKAVENASPHFMPSRIQFTPSVRFPGSRGHPFRSPGMRHHPYTMMRPMRTAPMNPNVQPRTFPSLNSPNKVDGQIIKIEPDANEETSNQSESNVIVQSVDNYSQPSSPSQTPSTLSNIKNESSDKDNDDANSNSSISSIPNETPPEGLTLGSDLTSLILGSQTTSSSAPEAPASGDVDQNVSVKVEAVSESEMDLEITGVEPGRALVSQSSWTSDSSMGMNFDPLGATGSQADLQASQQGYNASTFLGHVWEDTNEIDRQGVRKKYVCNICCKAFPRPSKLERHIRTHTGEKPFSCSICGRRFTEKGHLKSHMIVHLMSV